MVAPGTTFRGGQTGPVLNADAEEQLGPGSVKTGNRHKLMKYINLPKRAPSFIKPQYGASRHERLSLMAGSSHH